MKALDENKDQSYFLASVQREAFDGVRFPLGELHKTEVRAIARQLGLPNHQRKDSTGICFIGERRMRDFLAAYLPARPGEIVDLNGRVLGEHPGVAFFTVGQRRGLALGGVTGAREAPWYVVDRDIATNRLIVDQDPQHPRLMARRIDLLTPHWIRRPAGAGSDTPLALDVRIRHRQRLQRAELLVGNDGAQLEFAEPQRAAAAGQSARARVVARGDVRKVAANLVVEDAKLDARVAQDVGVGRPPGRRRLQQVRDDRRLVPVEVMGRP